MHIVVTQPQFKAAIDTVAVAVASKSTLPVLGNVLLTSDHGRLKLSGTNLEFAITTRIPAEVIEDGGITVNADLLANVVGSLPNDNITLTLNPRTQTLRLVCGNFITNIKGIEADEFPSLPVPAQSHSATITGKELSEAIRQVAFAAASDDSRPVLAGVFFRMRDNRLTLAAADGFRLANRTISLATQVGVAEFIVPGKNAEMLAKILPDEAAVSIIVTLNSVFFKTDTVEVTSRLIDGKFPDFERIIPTRHHTRVVLETDALKKAVKLAALFAGGSQNVVRLSIGEQLEISANAAEVGDNTGTIEGTVEGEGNMIGMNVKYLADAIDAITTPQIAFEMQTPQSPGVLKPVGQEGHVQIIMPMSLR